MLAVAPLGVRQPVQSVDVAPFGFILPEGDGVYWEDPREIHRMVVHFRHPPPPPDCLQLEYWSSRWPEQRLPTDREPGGGDVGWWELGNWYTGEWRVADAAVEVAGTAATFTFRPLNEHEFPQPTGFPAAYRFTLKIRVTSDLPLPDIERLEAYTDSTWVQQRVRLVWQHARRKEASVEAFNGEVISVEKSSPRSHEVDLWKTENPNPNTFDRTLVTVKRGRDTFTFAVDDLQDGCLFLPHIGVAVLPDEDGRDYAAVVAEYKEREGRSLYDRIYEMPEQTWTAAWEGMPPKRSHIYFPLGLDGGRQRFRLDADGSVTFRTNDHFLEKRPGKDTPRLALEAAPVHIGFGFPDKPDKRTIVGECLPVCVTNWHIDDVEVQQTAFVTTLEGADASGLTPAGDTSVVFMARFTFHNGGTSPQRAVLSMVHEAGGQKIALRIDEQGLLWAGKHLRGQVTFEEKRCREELALPLSRSIAPGKMWWITVKLPYLILTKMSERKGLAQLDFDQELRRTIRYWGRRHEERMRLSTPDAMLNEFHESHATHLVINCEREPDSDRRFARVGSFSYGAFSNESCMMVVDLDRRGYHTEARQCLDAWLHYQGTVGLPGDFSSQEGVLYGAGGYEHGGYNQHHGWILWCLAEHYKFTRDAEWLRRSARNILAGADWIVRERKRTDLGRGLLPAGSLEDIGDWWFWLSTNCYTWRGLDAAAWALAQMGHHEARRLQKEADAYHKALLTNFRKAAERSPVVRLRDGTSVPKFPSHAHRRGRSFGWICETLEGAIHLLISGALDPNSREAEWILKDYEDNLYLSNQWGYVLDDFEKHWFGCGGMSMQSCLLFNVEPYLYRDDVKHALRAAFNAIAVGYFPDVRMITEHALPNMGDWRGDHYKSSDEANAAGWLRYLFVREGGDDLLLGQAVPRDWLQPGKQCGVARAATHFGPMSLAYTAEEDQITVQLDAPRRNPPSVIRLRFREPKERPLRSVKVGGRIWTDFEGEWVRLPGEVGAVTIISRW